MINDFKCQKVLVISHNVFSSSSSMGRTLMNFFKDWKSDCIAQLYLHTEIPTTRICSKYYRITDFDNINKRKRDMGRVFTENDIDESRFSERTDKGMQAMLYQYGRKRKPYMYVGRNLLWSMNRWNNKKLNDWIDDFNPEIIFFASGDYVFAYKIAMKIAKRKNIPIVTYICDDFYFAKRKSVSPLYYINRMQFKATMKELFSKNKTVISICDKISRDYAKEFGVDAHTIMTSTTMHNMHTGSSQDKVRISYLGNLGYKRYEALIEIGRALKKITNGSVFLDVYSTEPREEILTLLNRDNGIDFKGAVNYSEVTEIMKKSDILIHVESMDYLCREQVRYSVSTKIADSLACGTCLFAYGPGDVASIEYLRDNDCACVVTDKKQLEDVLSKILFDKNLRNEYVNRALKAASENHNIDTNAVKFRKIITGAVENHESNAN